MFRKLILTILMVFMASPAFADPYISGMGGYNWLNEGKNSFNGAITSRNTYNTGWTALGAVGYQHGNFRIEEEIGYRGNTFDQISAPVGSVRASGDISAISYMTNAFYDIQMGSFSPYLGVGVGTAQIRADVSVGGVTLVNDSAYVFAYQPIVGMRYDLNRNFGVMMDWRYFGTTDPSFDTPLGPVDSTYQSQTVNIGGMWRW